MFIRKDLRIIKFISVMFVRKSLRIAKIKKLSTNMTMLRFSP